MIEAENFLRVESRLAGLPEQEILRLLDRGGAYVQGDVIRSVSPRALDLGLPHTLVGAVTPENFATLAETTTNDAAGAGTNSVAGTTSTVVSRTAFPQSGQFRMLIQNTETDKTNREITLVTGGFGTGAGAFTVTRAAERAADYPAVAHPIGSYAAQVLSADAQRRFAPDYLWQPRHNGLLAWSHDAQIVGSSGVAPSAGTVYLNKIYIPETMTLSNAGVYVITAGTGATALANCFLGLYDSTGALLGVTATQATAWATAGFKSAALTVQAGKSLTVVGGPDVWVFWALLVGTQSTTNVAMARVGTLGSSGPINANISSNFRRGTANTAQTALPATLGAQTASGHDMWGCFL